MADHIAGTEAVETNALDFVIKGPVVAGGASSKELDNTTELLVDYHQTTEIVHHKILLHLGTDRFQWVLHLGHLLLE